MAERERDEDDNADADADADEATSASGKRRTGTDVVLWGLALFAGCRAIELFLEAQAMASSVGQAILVEWGSSRLGIVWSDPKTPVTTKAVARRAGIGAAAGLGLGATVAVVLAASGGAIFASVAHVEPSIVVLGVLAAALTAWRDELVLHGVVLRALDDSGIAKVGRVLACGATSAGAALGKGDASPRTVVVGFVLGTVFGALWSRDRGAWQPWAANTTFRFVTATLLSGGFAQSRVADNAWGGGSGGMLGGTAAVVALAPWAVLALVWATRTGSPHSAPVG